MSETYTLTIKKTSGVIRSTGLDWPEVVETVNRHIKPGLRGIWITPTTPQEPEARRGT